MNNQPNIPDEARQKRLVPPANRSPVTVDKPIRFRIASRPQSKGKHYARKPRRREIEYDERNVRYY